MQGENLVSTCVQLSLGRMPNIVYIQHNTVDERKCSVCMVKNLCPGRQCLYPVEVSLPVLTKIIQLTDLLSIK
jgi:hypothetical protein